MTTACIDRIIEKRESVTHGECYPVFSGNKFSTHFRFDSTFIRFYIYIYVIFFAFT